MTIRPTQFTATQKRETMTIPTGPLPVANNINQPQNINQQQLATNENPLSAFFRKSKLSLMLPSHGKWYPENSLKINEDGYLSVYAMTASDDIKFRTGDVTMSGKNIYDIVQNCIPNILQPKNIPHVDLDAILLAIRIASYGSLFDFVVNVPNTTLTKTLKLDGKELLIELNKKTQTNSWDEDLTIQDETSQSLVIKIYPIPIKNLFQTSKNIFNQRKVLTKNFDENENIKDEAIFSSTMIELTNNAIDLLVTSIQSLKILSSDNSVIVSLSNTSPQDSAQINQIIKNLDVEYFNTIKKHIDDQRKKYQFMTPLQHSTKKEISAGAPEEWSTELTFMGSDFLPEQK